MAKNSLDDFKQLKNLIKDPFNISSEKKTDFLVAPSDDAALSSVGQLSPFHILTKTTYEALFSKRNEKDRGIVPTLAFLEHWLTSYLALNVSGISITSPNPTIAPGSPSLTSHAPVPVSPLSTIPQIWITEILTNYFELKTSADASRTAQSRFGEMEAREFVETHFSMLHIPRYI